jgi:pimeloyl-ACP methyl ester carboxylesterase
MDHLGIRQFFFFGNCIGGSFALKLMERAPDRVVAGILSQPIGHRPESPDVMCDLSRDVGEGIPHAAARGVDGNHRAIPAQTLPCPARLRVRRVARVRAQLPDADACPAGRHLRTHTKRSSTSHRWRRTNADVSVYPWKDPPELKARTINRARRFLKAHLPMTAAR